jgi:hypothetical protein
MPTIFRYGIAVLSVAIGIGLGFFLLQHFEAKLTPFLFAVAATVWYAGTGPGVLAMLHAFAGLCLLVIAAAIILPTEIKVPAARVN